MKNTFKLFKTRSRILCAIYLLALIAFLIAACDSGFGSSGTGGNSDGGQAFTSWESLATWLNTQPNNTKSNPYSVKVTVNNFANNFINVVRELRIKYVNLDLSGSTFTGIGNGAFAGCSGLTSITIPSKRKMTHFTQLQG